VFYIFDLIQCFHLVNFVPDTMTANQWLWCKLWLNSLILSWGESGDLNLTK